MRMYPVPGQCAGLDPLFPYFPFISFLHVTTIIIPWRLKRPKLKIAGAVEKGKTAQLSYEFTHRRI